ncbi:exonuclease III [Escherichia coli]|uniref:Exonuclease III n=1 Tax=Escherichia coli TaxID=562 RepID=A0A377BA59_ECOLX|nr:exonuclease III [Escherichia coli]
MDGQADELGVGSIPSAMRIPQTADRFSWFDYRSKGFDDNRGLRIDLLLASQPLAECCVETGIDYEIRSMEKPSDHAPVWATFRR